MITLLLAILVLMMNLSANLIVWVPPPAGMNDKLWTGKRVNGKSRDNEGPIRAL